MSFWDQLSSSTSSPTGSAVVEDPYARAVRLYEMELTNAAATAEARRGVAPNMGFDALTGSSFQLSPLDAFAQGPARGARAFGDTEADIQREVMAPALQFGDEVMEPFRRSNRGTARAPARPAAPIVRGSADSGYFTFDPISGKTTEIRPANVKAAKPDYTKAQEATIRNKYIDMKADQSKAMLARDRDAMAVSVQEMEMAYPWLVRKPPEFSPSIGDLRQSEQGSIPSARKMTWDSKQRKLVPAK